MIAKIQNIHVFNVLYDIKCVHLNLFSSDFSKKIQVKAVQWWKDSIHIFYVVAHRKKIFTSCKMQMRLVFRHFMYLRRRRASRFEITLHKTLSLNDEFNDTTWKKESATRLQTRATLLKPPFVINLLGFYLSSYIITTSHRWRGSLWCNRMHTTPFCFFWPETRTHGHKL